HRRNRVVVTGNKDRLPAISGLDSFQQLVCLIRVEQRDRHARAIRKRLDGLLRALVLRGVDRVAAGAANLARDLLRALDTFGRQIGIGISWLDLLLGVTDEYHSRARARES